MKHLKMFGLAALVAMALMAVVGAGSASAAGGRVCSTATNPCGSPWAVPTTLDFSLAPESSAKLVDTSNNTLDTCTTSTVKGKLETNSGGVATGTNEEITWGGCSPFAANTVTLGKLKIEAEAESPDTGNGELFADSEIEVTVSVSSFLGGPCIYKIPSGRTIGTWKESTQRFIANAVAERTQTSTHPCIFGTETNKWTAEYQKTTPASTTLYVSTS